MEFGIFSTLAYAASEAVNTYPSGGDGILAMIYNAGTVVKFVLLLLLLLSVACWCIILIKMRLFRQVRIESERFMEVFQERPNLAAIYRDSHLFENSYLAQIFQTGYGELGRLTKSIDVKNLQEGKVQPETWLESVQRAMEGAILIELQRLERFLSLLATTGSTAPFIGLFGTVWGIMTSFREIGLKGAANLAVVAPGISEALIATAVGLAAAIPAVVAYNYFANRVRTVENQMNHFVGDFLNILKRDLIRRAK